MKKINVSRMSEEDLKNANIRTLRNAVNTHTANIAKRYDFLGRKLSWITNHYHELGLDKIGKKKFPKTIVIDISDLKSVFSSILYLITLGSYSNSERPYDTLNTFNISDGSPLRNTVVFSRHINDFVDKLRTHDKLIYNEYDKMEKFYEKINVNVNVIMSPTTHNYLSEFINDLYDRVWEGTMGNNSIHACIAVLAPKTKRDIKYSGVSDASLEDYTDQYIKYAAHENTDLLLNQLTKFFVLIIKILLNLARRSLMYKFSRSNLSIGKGEGRLWMYNSNQSINYNKLSKLGYNNLNNKYVCTSEDYNIYINTLNAQFTKAYSEGIFGALNTARRGVRDTAQFGVQALKKLIELIKKVIGGFIDMCKKVVLEVGNQRQRMTKCIGKLKDLENDLSEYKTTYDTAKDHNAAEEKSEKEFVKDESNQGEINANAVKPGVADKKDMSNIGTINIVTVASLNTSGWNLSEINKNPMRESKLNNTLAWFCKTLADNYELDPYTQLAYSKNFDQLMSRLENMFEIAEKQYDKDEMYYLISVRDKIRRALANIRVNAGAIFRQYKYTGLPPKTYGRYVAQAFSPAGAFVTTNPNDSFNRAMKRTKNYLNAMTPNKVAVPLDKAYIAGNEHSMENAGEVTKTLNYLYLVVTYLDKIDPLDYFKDKVERIGKLQRQMDVFLKMTDQDMRKAKDANYNNPTFNDGGDGKVMSYEDNKKQEEEQRRSMGSGQSILAIQNALMADLEAFGEEDSTYGLGSNPANFI